LERKDIKEMWTEDLNEFIEKYEEYLRLFIENENVEYTKVATKGRVRPMDLNAQGISKEMAAKPLTAR
jgi:hypothetical protein